AFTYHLPLRGLLLPEGGEWRILSTIKLLLNTIDYQIIIFLIKFTTKFEEEPHFPSGRRGLLFLYRQHKLA
ncbi:MAG: hypothetical protein E6X58_06615, partial [Bacteroides sp.]|nr:hypothetical protein [Bacteroides sp.]